MTAVGRYPDGRPEDENAPFPEERKKSTYAAVKRLMQDEVLKYAEKFNTVVVAPTAVFGEEDRKPTTGAVILEVAKGKLPVSLDGRTNVVDVHLVADGVLSALEKGSNGRLYVLGGENMTLTQMMTKIAIVAQVKPPYVSLSPKAMLPFAKASELIGDRLGKKRPLLPQVGIDFALYGEFISSEIAKKELGYDPSKSDTSEVIKRTLDWFKANGYL